MMSRATHLPNLPHFMLAFSFANEYESQTPQLGRLLPPFRVKGT